MNQEFKKDFDDFEQLLKKTAIPSFADPTKLTEHVKVVGNLHSYSYTGEMTTRINVSPGEFMHMGRHGDGVMFKHIDSRKYIHMKNEKLTWDDGSDFTEL